MSYKFVDSNKSVKKANQYKELINSIIEQINEEKDVACADFDKYKVEYLGVDADDLPEDDFKFGMERALEIFVEKLREVEE